MKRIFALFMVALLATGCSQTPDWDYDKTVQFSNYKSFAFAPNASIEGTTTAYQVNGLMEKRLRDAIETELKGQGFATSDESASDLLVNFHVSVDKKITEETVNTMYTGHWNYWGWGVQTHSTKQEFDVGTIIIDIIDNKAKQLVWRGVKEGRLKKNQTPDERTEAVNKTVKEILANFPPKSAY